MATVRAAIERRIGELSPRERQIARLVIERYPISALGGIEDIARQSRVSPPTVTRFVRRLGFERFADFQRAIRLEIQDAEASPLALFQRHRNERPAGENALIDDLRKSLETLKDQTRLGDAARAAALLADEKRRINVLGGRWTSIAAQYLAFQLSSMRGGVRLLTPPPSGLVEDALAEFSRRDVLALFDVRRYQGETIRFAEAARRRGATLLLFTDPEISPIGDLAEAIIRAPVATLSPLDTLAPMLAACDDVLLRLLRDLGGKAEKRMRLLEEVRHSVHAPHKGG
jgi:DNA-binding MurR/RpiR family transcriptional regulator